MFCYYTKDVDLLLTLVTEESTIEQPPHPPTPNMKAQQRTTFLNHYESQFLI